jgi:hypothetical protein
MIHTKIYISADGSVIVLAEGCNIGRRLGLPVDSIFPKQTEPLLTDYTDAQIREAFKIYIPKRKNTCVLPIFVV